jgi:NAD(P)-dependent dehydrogenase (short-subunit alcohol dehydrogenase family)
MQLNYFGALRMVRALAPQMIKRGEDAKPGPEQKTVVKETPAEPQKSRPQPKGGSTGSLRLSFAMICEMQ